MADNARQPNAAQIRASAARAVHAVTEYNRTIDWVFGNKPQWVASAESAALFYGTVRHLLFLKNTLAHYLDRDFRKKDLDLYCLLLVGAYQLLWSDKPVHATINETVAAAKLLRKPWARGLINAILRRLAENRDTVEYPDQTFDHPNWLLDALQTDYPDQWQAIAAANNARAPMALRVNLCKNTRKEYAELLQQQGVAYRFGAAPQCILLTHAMRSAQLPGWQEGRVAVQDMGAQYAACLLHDAIGRQPSHAADTPETAATRVLDACAAPGGKLAHLLELTQDSRESADSRPIQTVAIEVSSSRIEATQAILGRLGHDVEIAEGDACTLNWWDQQPFGFILLDAPCSGTGTIRRHPDIKLLLTEQALAEHSRIQLQMLNNLWQTLAPGGTLLYCTCSLLQAENDAVIGRFLESDNIDANVLTVNLPSGRATRYGWQLLPTTGDTDGFYYALLQKH